MKKNFLIALIILLLAFGIGCDLHSSNDDAKSPDGLAISGVITGDVFYRDIVLGQLFIESFVDILGPPLSQREAFFFYEGLEILGDRGDLVGSVNMAIQLWGFDPSLHLFEINGVSLDMNRAELISTFGPPIEYYEYHDWIYRDSDDVRSISYHILGGVIDYLLDIRFEDPNDSSRVTSISIIRMFHP